MVGNQTEEPPAHSYFKWVVMTETGGRAAKGARGREPGQGGAAARLRHTG